MRPKSLYNWIRTVLAIVIWCSGLAMPLMSLAAEVSHFVARRTSEETKTSAGWSAVTGTAGTGTTASTNGWIDNSNFSVGERYLIIATGYHQTSNNNGRSGFRVTHGGVAFGESEGTEETDRTGTAYKTPYFWFTVWTAADEDVEIEYYNESASHTARVDDVKLIVLNVEDLITNNDLKYSISTTSGALTTTFASKTSLTWTPANNGDTWWIMAYTRGDIQTLTGDAYAARLNIDGTTFFEQETDGEDTNDSPIYGLGWAQTLSNASHTIDVEIRETVGNQGWFAAGVFALRLNSFDTYVINTVSGAQSLSAGTGSYNQISTVTRALGRSGDAIVAGGAVIDDKNGRVTARLDVDDTTPVSTEYGGWQPATTDNTPFTAIGLMNYDARESHSFDLDARETSNVTPDPDAYDSWIVYFSLEEKMPDRRVIIVDN